MTRSRMFLIDRRRLVAGFAVTGLGACSDRASAQAGDYDIAVHRNRGCSCCEAWAGTLRDTGHFKVSLIEESNMDTVRRRLAVPSDLAACHTAEVSGLVIEGHVPAADVLRLLTERPPGVIGLAVPGMPIGSPGMDQPGAAREPFEVFAFRTNGAQSVFARHA